MSTVNAAFRTFVALLAASVLVGWATGCSKEEPVTGPVVKKIAPKPGPASPAVAVAEEKKPVIPQHPVYDPAGKRDPFVSFVATDRERSIGAQASLPPLQRYELGELRFVGLIWTQKGARALVQDGEGKGYSLVVGSRVGRSGGVVSRITDKEITVREEFPGVGGKMVSRESVLQLITAGGNP